MTQTKQPPANPGRFTYPLAGWLGAAAGFAVMAVLAALGVVLAALLWPPNDAAAIEHEHAGLPPGHPHRHGAVVPSGPGRFRHRHAIVINREHPRWPRPVS